VDGWAKMHQRFGKLPWKDLFTAAIAYADQGFPVTEAIQEAWRGAAQAPKMKGASAALFLPGGKPPQVGEMFRNPDLARVYRTLAEKGPDAFYKGEIAAAILKTSQRLDGTMTAEDLSSFSSEWVQPISIDYRGWRVYELPPNGQGMAALEMLNSMETARSPGEGTPAAAEIHKRIEAMKLAYSDLRRYNADPRSYDVPVGQLISKEYARKRATLIEPAKANCTVPAGQPVSSDTTYLTVVDKDGNIASWIQSLSASFGSGITVTTGVLSSSAPGRERISCRPRWLATTRVLR
jgi:gamma-glutamyltranspeptidase/glutathione hydrolase